MNDLERTMLSQTVLINSGLDDDGLDAPIYFSGQGCAGAMHSSVYYNLLRLAAAVPSFDVTPYRLTGRRVVLSADEARRLAEAVDEGASLAGESLEYYATYLAPLRAGALVLYPPAPDSDSPTGALAMDFA